MSCDLRLTFSIVSTAKNASSCLLRLPQELKNRIYELVLGGQFIHVQRKRKENKFFHRLCQAKISEKEAHETFAASKGLWFSEDIRDRHHACYDVSMIRQDCFRCPSHFDPPTEPYAVLSLALLRCCRQTYQETRSITFSANTWSFTCPWDFLSFCLFSMNSRVPFIRKLAIRRLHLDLSILIKAAEEGWNAAFDAIAENLKCLQHVFIDIEQRPFEDDHLKEWQFREPAESSFLGSLRRLRDLRLRTVTVTISDHHIWHPGMINLTTEDGSKYRWTMAQKQKWAGYIRRYLLRQEEQEPVTEKGA